MAGRGLAPRVLRQLTLSPDDGSGYTSRHLASKRISVMLAKVILQPVPEGA